MLKTNYKDDAFSGMRKYRNIDNDDGSYSVEDVTEYQQEGDTYGAEDVNASNRVINKLDNVIEVTLPLSGWSSGSAPYTQRVPVAGLKATDNPSLWLNIPRGMNSSNAKLRKKLTGMINGGEPEDGYMTFYCNEKRPTADFSVLLSGVSVNG